MIKQKKFAISLVAFALFLTTGIQDVYAAIPTIPSDFRAASFTGTTATLNWTDNSGDEDNFNIYYATTDTQPGAPAYTPAANATSQAAVGLSSTLDNFFWISAENTDGESSVQKICLKWAGQVDTLRKCGITNGSGIGAETAVDGDYAIISEYSDDEGGSRAGAAYIMRRDGDTWVEVKKLIASDSAADDWFSSAVDIRGNYAIVGSPRDDDGGSGSGSAYIFEKDFGGVDNWGERKKLVASDDATSDGFGYEVTIDTDTAIVGSGGDDDDGSASGSAYIFYKDTGGADNWGELKKITASDADAGDTFGGDGVALDGDIVVIGSDLNDDVGSNSGSAYIFERDFGGADNWGERKKLTASDAASGDRFSYSADTDGTYAVIGCYDCTSAYLFEKDFGGADNWGERKILAPKETASGFDWYGWDVAVDGNYAMVGDWGDLQGGFNDAGIAWLFEKDENGTDNWGNFGRFVSPAPSTGAHFGVGTSLEGDAIVLGANFADSEGRAYYWGIAALTTPTAPSDFIATSFSGTSAGVSWTDNASDETGFYIYQSNTSTIPEKPSRVNSADATSNTVFSLSTTLPNYLFITSIKEIESAVQQVCIINAGVEGKIIACDGEADDEFGVSLSVSGDYAVIGTSSDDDLGAEAGAAYIYRKSGTQWTEIKKITGADTAAGDLFGSYVAIDGTTAVIGATGDDDSGSASGSVYIFEKNTGGTDNWGETTKVTASDGLADDGFGTEVDISGDYAVIGANNNDGTGTDSGSAYIFERDFGGADTWGERAILTASDQGVDDDHFGIDVAISGTTAVVGSWFDDSPASNAGSAYIYEKDFGGADTWGERKKVVASDNAADDQFGGAVDIAGTYVVVGALNNDDTAADSGSAYIYEKDFGGVDNWGERKIITASDASASDFFGEFVAIDSTNLVVNGSGVETTYILEKDEGGADNWGEVRTFNGGDAIAGDAYNAISLSGDYLIVGSKNDDDNGSDSGSVYTHDITDPAPPDNKKFDAIGTAAEDFGVAVDVDGTLAIVGKPDIADFSGDGDVFIYRKNATTDEWEQKFAIVGVAGEAMGRSVTISGDYAAIGVPAKTGFAGEVQIYKRTTDTSWSLVDTVIGTGVRGGDTFGWSANMDGDYLVVGASQFAGSTTGLAFVFKRDTGLDTWSEVGALTASDATAGHYFGESVSIDASTFNVIIGADYSGTDSTGAAYIYNKDEGGADTWGEVQKLTAGALRSADLVGTGVSIDGSYALIGAPGYDGGDDTGIAYIFKETAGVWAETDSFQATDATAGFKFGQSVDLVGDYAAIGSSEADGIAASGEGKAYVFLRDTGLETWSQDTTFSASDGLASDLFGEAIAIANTADDYEIVVGAPDGDGAIADSGVAYFYGFSAAAAAVPGLTAAPIRVSCTVNPVKLDLPENLDVLQQSGSSVVELSWADSQSRDAAATDKIKVLIDYMDQEPTPQLDSTEKPMVGIFARHVYSEIYNSDSATLVDAFESELKKITNEESDATLRILSSLGIDYNNNYFSEWWAYLFVDKLKNNQPVAEAFMSAVSEVIESREITYEELIRRISNQFFTIERSPLEFEAAQCIGDAVAGVKLGDFVPGKGKNIYKDLDGELKNIIDQIKKQGSITSTLSALKRDQSLLANTETSLDIGINALLFGWVNNAKVQEVVDFYQKNPDFKNFRDLFFSSDIAKEIEECLKGTYKRSLSVLVNEVRASLVQKTFEQGEICNEDTSTVIKQVIEKLMTAPSTGEEIEAIMLKFINEVLAVEKHLTDATGYQNSFTDYFDENYAPPSQDSFDDLTLEIFRDGQLIYSAENPGFTSYIDEDVPVNDTGRVKTHKYFLLTSTECDTKQGSVGEADIEPQLSPGNSIDVDVDIKVTIKNGFNLLFIEKLEALVQEAKNMNIRQTTQALAQGTAPEEPQNQELLCLQATLSFASGNLNGDKVMNYILACHGNSEINSSLEIRRPKIVPPILLALKLNLETDRTVIIDQFVEPTIVQLTEEFSHAKNLFEKVGGQLAQLDFANGISGFDEDERELVMCGGVPDCGQGMRDKVTNYFQGSSHAADLSVEVYDQAGVQVYQTDATSDIFGKIENLGLGQFLSGQEYSIKIRPKNQKFVLPKLSKVTLNTAEPKSGGGFQAHLDLVYGRQFRYGNFDDSNDIIDRSDILIWGKLISENPELWDDSNLDGLYGVDLLDVITFQQNWGEIQESRLEESQITLMELAELFGLATNIENRIQVPNWLKFLELSCKN